MSDLVGNPEDRFSLVAAHMMIMRHKISILVPLANLVFACKLHSIDNFGICVSWTFAENKFRHNASIRII